RRAGRRGCGCVACARPQERARPARTPPGRSAVRGGALPRPDGSGLCGRRPGDLPVRGDDGRRGLGGGLAGDLRAPADRQRGAAAQRAAGGHRRRRHGGRRRRPDTRAGRPGGGGPDGRRAAAGGDDDGRRARGASRRGAPGGPGGVGRRQEGAARPLGRRVYRGNPVNTELQRVHMVGIGGAGMSGVARILLDRGGLVSGSDAKESRGIHALRARGAQIRIGHDASSLDLLPGGATAVITTHAAIPKTNPELVEARRRGIPVILRPAVLARLMDGRTTLMVTGTHGKTTTTSMLIVTLQHCGRDPSFAVGGEMGEAGTNAHHGSGDCFVAEADESDGSLLEYTPNVAVVTNIETDHLDFYGSATAYVDVFDSFVERLAPGGALVVCVDDPGAAALARRTAELGIR